MAFKRSAVRSRLSPPKETVTERWLFSFAEMGSPYTADLLLFNPIAATAAERRLVPGGDSIPLISTRRIRKGLISSEIKPFFAWESVSPGGIIPFFKLRDQFVELVGKINRQRIKVFQ